jgi:hypothetical protein
LLAETNDFQKEPARQTNAENACSISATLRMEAARLVEATDHPRFSNKLKKISGAQAVCTVG